jgi:hypothetical protein
MKTTVNATGPLEAFVGPFEPVAYMWQHPGTGLIGFVEYNGNDEFLERWAHANHPRQIIAPLYAIPNGWALVPKVPTENMVEANAKLKLRRIMQRGKYNKGVEHGIVEEWNAMLGAVSMESHK